MEGYSTKRKLTNSSADGSNNDYVRGVIVPKNKSSRVSQKNGFVSVLIKIRK